jgi:hypothetical protein
VLAGATSTELAALAFTSVDPGSLWGVVKDGAALALSLMAANGNGSELTCKIVAVFKAFKDYATNLGATLSANKPAEAAYAGARAHRPVARIVIAKAPGGTVVALQNAINDFVEQHNQRPTPFVWKADPKDIIAAAKRGHQTLETIH